MSRLRCTLVYTGGVDVVSSVDASRSSESFVD